MATLSSFGSTSDGLNERQHFRRASSAVTNDADVLANTSSRVGPGPLLTTMRIPAGISLGIRVGVNTTIKVPVELRDRINRDAHEQGVTAAGLIEKLLDGYERRRRMEAFGRAFRGADLAYRDELREWDVALADGQDGN